MLKSQRFSSLFRHYAKYHGLRKDDLEYYFTNLLENEDTPESVQLQRGDTIMVRKKRPPTIPEVAADDDEFFKDMKELLHDEEHMDMVFLVRPNRTGPKRVKREEGYIGAVAPTVEDEEVGKVSDTATTTVMDLDAKQPATVASDEPTNKSSTGGDVQNMKIEDDASDNNTSNKEPRVHVRAHLCVLTTRTEYFRATFRTGVKTEGVVFQRPDGNRITVDPAFVEKHVRWTLEFIYTNRIKGIRSLSTADLLSLLHLSDLWLLRDLKRLIEHELIRSHLSVNSVARLYGATELYHAKRLNRACIDYIMNNLAQMAANSEFLDEIQSYPQLCVPVLKAAADIINEGPAHKKQRTGEALTAVHQGTPTGGGGDASSPVPDSDP